MSLFTSQTKLNKLFTVVFCGVAFYLSRAVANKPECNLVWPGERHELVPPSRDDLRHVEARQKRDRDELAEAAGVDADHLKRLAVKVIFEEDVSVDDAEKTVRHEEDDKVVPDELEDAALPEQKHVPDSIEPLCCVLVLVRVDVRGGSADCGRATCSLASCGHPDRWVGDETVLQIGCVVEEKLYTQQLLSTKLSSSRKKWFMH